MPPRRQVRFARAPAIVEEAVADAGAGAGAGMVLGDGAGVNPADAEPDDYAELMDAAVEFDLARGRRPQEGVIEPEAAIRMRGSANAPRIYPVRVHGGGGGGADRSFLHQDAFALRQAVARLAPGTAALALGGQAMARLVNPMVLGRLRGALVDGGMRAFDQELVAVAGARDQRHATRQAAQLFATGSAARRVNMQRVIAANLQAGNFRELRDQARALGGVDRILGPIAGVSALDPNDLFTMTREDYVAQEADAARTMAGWAAPGGIEVSDFAVGDGTAGVLEAYGAVPEVRATRGGEQAALVLAGLNMPELQRQGLQSVLTQQAMRQAIGTALVLGSADAVGALAANRGLGGGAAMFTPLNGGATRVGMAGRLAMMGMRVDPFATAGNAVSRMQAFVLQIIAAIRSMLNDVHRRFAPTGDVEGYAIMVHYFDADGMPRYAQTGFYHNMADTIRHLLQIFTAARDSTSTAAVITNVRQIEIGVGRVGGFRNQDGELVAGANVLGATSFKIDAGPRVRYPGLVSGQGPVATSSLDGRRADDGWMFATRLNAWAMHSGALVLTPSEIVFPPELLHLVAPGVHAIAPMDVVQMPRYKHLCVAMAILVSTVHFTDSKNGEPLPQSRFPVPAFELLDGVARLQSWTTEAAQRFLLGPDGQYGFLWVEEAHRLHTEAGLIEGEGVDSGPGLQKLADHLGFFIHVITREAGNQITRVAVPHGALKDRNAATPPHGHIYLYAVEKGGFGHTHAVVRPLALLRGDRATEPRALCHYCGYDTYEQYVLTRHLAMCPVFTGDDENPSSTGKVFKSLAARYLKDDYRLPGPGETRHGFFCCTCLKLLPVVQPDGQPHRRQRRARGNGTDPGRPNPETPLAMMEEQFMSLGRKQRAARLIAGMGDVDVDLTEEGRSCIRAGHLVRRGALLICCHCHAYFPEGDEKKHRCFCIVPDKLKQGNVQDYWFFDFESMELSETRQDCEVARRHRVIFVHLQNHDGSKAYDYHSLGAFCADVFGKKEFHGCTFISHNGGRYDVQFILGWLLKHGMMPEFQTLSGSTTSILQLQSMGRRFIDSYRFLTMPLASMSKTFKLEVSKGHFPHEFATEARWRENNGAGYHGPMPGPEFYGLLTMRGDGPVDVRRKQEALVAWHAEESIKYKPFTARPWVLREQMQNYCRDDVRVLRQACFAFRNLFLAMKGSVEATGAGAAWVATSVDPLQYMTLPQVGLQVFLSGLQVRVAHFPHRIDWRLEKEAYMWMESVAEEHSGGRQGLVVRHRGHTSDRLRFTVRGAEGQDVHGWLRLADGAPPEQDVALVYLECRDHGCRTCMTDRDARHPILNQSYDEVEAWSNRWLASLTEVLGGGERVRTMRACDWQRRCQDEMAGGHYAVVRRWQDAGVPLSWNDYFMGGEVDVKASYCKAPPGWHIEHVDVTSMYPWVCVEKMLPTGHPIVIWDQDVNPARLRPDHPDAYFGIVRCKVVPPPNLVVPVLPSKRVAYADGVAVDPYELAAEEAAAEEAAAADGTRLVLDLNVRIGSWTTAELHQALERGYIIEKVYEVHHFPPSQRRVGLFRGYVDYFLRLKIEAEGWPASLAGASPEEKAAWCDEVARQNGGIGRPREDSIAKNPGLRTFAKLMLNSLWGKFAQSPRSDGRAYLNTGGDFDALFMNPLIRKDNLALMPVTKHSYIAQYKLVDKYTQSPSRSNFYLAAFVTAHARVRLHEMMRAVGERSVLYCDTDSVVYVCPDGREGLPTAPGLGNLTNELGEVRCVEFICTGNKSYCKVFDRPNEEGESFEMKQKGLTLHASNQEILTPDLMRDTVLGIYNGTVDEGEAVAELDAFSIRSVLRRVEGVGEGADGTDTQVYSENRPKKFAAQYTKRRMLRRADTGVDAPVIIPTVPHGVRVPLDYAKMVSVGYLEEAWADQSLACAGMYPVRGEAGAAAAAGAAEA